VSPALGAVLFAAAVWVLHRELRQVRYREVAEAVRALPPARLLLAFLLTFANYAILTGFDLLAFEYVGKRIAGGGRWCSPRTRGTPSATAWASR
jgi:phosphatidylglycerol lysyltransferase